MKLLALLIAAVILQGCTITGAATKGVSGEEHFNYTLLFCRDSSCLKELLNLINSSEEAACAFYNADESVLQLLQQKNSEAIVDRKAKTYGTTTLRRNNTALMHNKFCVFDRKIVWTGSFNPTKRHALDDVIIINSTLLSGNYLKEAEELKNNGSGRKTTTTKIMLNNTLVESYFCPEDNCIDVLQSKLAAANSSIYFATYSFTHPKISNELIIKNSEGVEVKGIIENSGGNSQLLTLQLNNVSAAKDSSKKLMHHKFFIIDESAVITGSFNPTRNGDERNDENMLIIHNREVAKEYLDYFGELTQKA